MCPSVRLTLEQPKASIEDDKNTEKDARENREQVEDCEVVLDSHNCSSA